jgi:hypothetical protein
MKIKDVLYLPSGRIFIQELEGVFMTDTQPIIIMPKEIAKDLYSICDDYLGVILTKETTDRLQLLLQRCLANYEITDLEVRIDPSTSLLDVNFIPIDMSIEEWNRKHTTPPPPERVVIEVPATIKGLSI